MTEQTLQPFYDPERTYAENLAAGPFGIFADGTVFAESESPQEDFLGIKTHLPFGIPAGPVPNARFAKAALDKGFDLVTYKTVRSRPVACNEFPNVLPLAVEGDLTLNQAAQGIWVKNGYESPLTITNSFGVPSFAPEIWQPDLAEAVRHAREGQVVIGSFQGTIDPAAGTGDYVADFAKTARLVQETGVRVFEVNLSCPNEGTAHLLCFDLDRVKAVAEAVKNAIGDAPLIIKIAYFADQAELTRLVMAVGRIVQGIAAINTIPAKIYRDPALTEPALPGNNRLLSGTCGDGVRWAGLEMVSRLHALREANTMDFAIIGTGGVTAPEHYAAYRQFGADAVMSATGAMWNPLLAQAIKRRQKVA